MFIRKGTIVLMGMLYLIFQSTEDVYAFQDQEAQQQLKIALTIVDNAPDSSILLSEKILKQHNSGVLAVNAHLIIGSALKNKGEYQASKTAYFKSLELAKRESLKELEFKLYSNLGELYYRLSKLDSSLQYHDMAFAILNDISVDSLNLGNAYLLRGNANFGKSKLEEAAEDYLASTRIYEAIDNKIGAAKVLNNLGVIYMYLKNFEKAVEHFERSLAIKIEIDDKRGISKAYNNLGELYHHQFGDTLKALDYFQKSVEIKRLIKDKIGVASSLSNVADVLWDLGDQKKAMAYYDESLDIWEEAGDPEGEAYILQELGKKNRDLGNTEKALYYYEKSREAYVNLSHKNLTYNYLYSSELSYELGRFKEAHDYLRKYLVLKDSLFESDRHNQILALEAKYENEKKENEIALLNKETELQASILSRSRILQFTFLGAFILAAVVGVLFYSRFKIKKKGLEEKEILLREIHHRVKNNLQIVESLLNLQNEMSTNNSPKEVLKLCQDRIHAISVVHEKLYNSKDFKAIKVDNYVGELVDHFKQTYEMDNVNIDSKLDKISLDLDQLIPCGLILNEVITNSIKYAFRGKDDGEINITGYKQDDNFHLEVADNGVGFESSEVKGKETLGMKLIRSLTGQLDGESSFESVDGVTFKLKFAI